MTGKRTAAIAASIAYLVQSVGPGMPVKIGITNNVLRRLQTLTTQGPFEVDLRAVFAAGAETERQFKRRFSQLRLQGEWFRPHADMNVFVREQFAAGRLLVRIGDQERFLEDYIFPAVRAYLNGREPNNNDRGDLVYRLLNGGLRDLTPRVAELQEATRHTISADLFRGFVPAMDSATVGTVMVPEVNQLETHRMVVTQKGAAA